MQFKSLADRSWLHEAWRHKASVVAGVLAIVSLSLAHYAGFLIDLPLQIVAVAGMPLASGVTATFLFYLFFCAVFARVLASIMQLITLPFLAVADRLGPGVRLRMEWSHQRRFVRTHSQTIKWEGFVWILVQALMLLFMMLAIYLKAAFSWLTAVGIAMFFIPIVLSGLIRSGYFLQPKPRAFIRKIRTRRTRYGRAASAAFVTTTAALIIMAFVMGNMRASLLRDQTPHMVVTKEFTGIATVIASSEGALLLFQKQGKELRYIYSSPEFTASIESKPVFPPIGSNKKE